MKISKKGFIGSIGDDLPSLIPIVFALLIFFSAFSATLSVYNSENASVSTDMGMLAIARSLKGDSLLLNLSQFEKRCDDLRIQKYPYNFMVAVYGAEKDLDTVIADFAETRVNGDISDSFLTGEVEDETRSYFCGYRKLGSKDFGDIGTGDKSREQYSLRYYPVAVQTKVIIGTQEYYVIIPGVLAMIIW